MSEREFDLTQFHVTIVPSLKDICSVFKYSLLFIPLRGFSYNQIHKSGGKKSFVKAGFRIWGLENMATMI